MFEQTHGYRSLLRSIQQNNRKALMNPPQQTNNHSQQGVSPVFHHLRPVQVKQPPPSQQQRPPRLSNSSVSSTPTPTTACTGTPISTANRRIAIAIDFSEESEFAIKWAVQNYIRPGDAIILLHVRPTSVLYGADWGATTPNNTNIAITYDPSTPEKQQLEEEFDNLTNKQAAKLAEPLLEGHVPFKIKIVKDHDMKERLCLEVERLGLNAMIMGSIGSGASKKNNKEKLGSVSDYCVQHCGCPVVVVRFPDQKNTRDEEETNKTEKEATVQPPSSC